MERTRRLTVPHFPTGVAPRPGASFTPSLFILRFRAGHPIHASLKWPHSSRLFFNGYQGESKAHRHISPTPTPYHCSLFFTKAAELAVVGLQVSTLPCLGAPPTSLSGVRKDVLCERYRVGAGTLLSSVNTRSSPSPPSPSPSGVKTLCQP